MSNEHSHFRIILEWTPTEFLDQLIFSIMEESMQSKNSHNSR